VRWFEVLMPRCVCWILLSLQVSAASKIQPAAVAGERSRQVPNGVRHAMASASAGAVAVTLVAPIEIIRLNLMNNKGLTIGMAAKTLRGGMMFRGNTADVIASACRTGIILPAFSYYKTCTRALAMRLDPTLEANGLLPQWALFSAGALAGATATLILFPLEVARTRMALECVVGQSTIGCLTTVFNAEGLRACYRGLTASMVGVMPFNAIKLTSYDTVRTLAIEARRRVHPESRAGGGPRDETAPTDVSLPPPVTAAIGAVSGVSAATLCFPIEVIRRRKMLGEFASLGVPQSIGALVRSEGASALYRGVGINAAKVSLGTGTTFCLYELMKDCLRVDGRQPPWEKRQSPRS